MKAAAETKEADLIDRIANALPAEVRSEYYREMRHCRSLPDNDEMLRILRAMQFLVLLIQQVPDRIAVETEKLRAIFTEILGAFQQISKSSQIYHAQLDRRLAALPQTIANGIRAEAIVANINESLRQQFVQTTIPDTGHALAASAAQFKRSTAEFAQSARELGNTYSGAVEEARKAVANLESTGSQAITKLERQATNASHIFERGNRWSLYVLLTFALVLGIGLERAYDLYVASPEPQVTCAPVAQPAMPAPHVKSKPKH